MSSRKRIYVFTGSVSADALLRVLSDFRVEAVLHGFDGGHFSLLVYVDEDAGSPAEVYEALEDRFRVCDWDWRVGE